MSDRLTFRLTAPLLVISAVVLGLALATAWYVQQLHSTVTEVFGLNIASLRAAEELEIGLREIRFHLDRYLFLGDMLALDRVPPLRKETDHWLDEADRAGTTPREQEQVGRIKQGYAHFFRELDNVTAAAPDAPDREDLRRLIDRVLTEEILVPTHEYLDYNEELAAQGTEDSRRSARRTVVVLVVLGVCGPAVGLLAGFLVARRLYRSIVRLSVPIQDASGKLAGVVGPTTLAGGWGLDEMEAVLCRLSGQVGDVVERLQRSQREALRAEQLAAVGQMAAGFAHELRNPLMSMKLLVQAAAESGGPDALSAEDLAVLEEEILRLERLTTTVLDFARPPHADKQVVELRRVVEGSVDLVAGQAARRDVRIDCEFPDEPVHAEADAGQVRQVVLNLLLNALEALQEGGEVLLRVTGAGPWVTLEVADSGPGLPPGLGGDIFAPFVSTKPTGIGLGLSVCKRIAEAHGGEITATNRPGGGAAFALRLPAGRTACPAPVPGGGRP